MSVHLGVSAAVRRCIEARSGRPRTGWGLGGCGGAGRRSAWLRYASFARYHPAAAGVPRLFTLRRMGSLRCSPLRRAGVPWLFTLRRVGLPVVDVHSAGECRRQAVYRSPLRSARTGCGAGWCGVRVGGPPLASIRELRSLLTPRRVGVPWLFTLRRVGLPVVDVHSAG